MHAQFLRECHNVLAALQPLHRHPAELVRITSHSFLCHLQFLSLHSVPFPSVSFCGFSPLRHNAKPTLLQSQCFRADHAASSRHKVGTSQELRLNPQRLETSE